MKNIEDRKIERIAMILFGTIILCFVVLYRLATFAWWTVFLWWGLGVFYVLAAMMSYLGYSKWNVLWQEELSDAAQMAMWLWDLTIALCAFMML